MTLPITAFAPISAYVNTMKKCNRVVIKAGSIYLSSIYLSNLSIYLSIFFIAETESHCAAQAAGLLYGPKLAILLS
jgi:hypothetical protein